MQWSAILLLAICVWGPVVVCFSHLLIPFLCRNLARQSWANMPNWQLYSVGLVSGLIKLNNAAGMVMQTTSWGRENDAKGAWPCTHGNTFKDPNKRSVKISGFICRSWLRSRLTFRQLNKSPVLHPSHLPTC